MSIKPSGYIGQRDHDLSFANASRGCSRASSPRRVVENEISPFFASKDTSVIPSNCHSSSSGFQYPTSGFSPTKSKASLEIGIVTRNGETTCPDFVVLGGYGCLFSTFVPVLLLLLLFVVVLHDLLVIRTLRTLCNCPTSHFFRCIRHGKEFEQQC